MEGVKQEDLHGFKNLRSALGENTQSQINIDTETNVDNI